jgi:hypothetical protein
MTRAVINIRLVAGDGDQARGAPADEPLDPLRGMPRSIRSAGFKAKVPFSIQNLSGQTPRSVTEAFSQKHYCRAAVSVPWTK